MGKKRPYIWLQENEPSGRAVCGCELRNSSRGPAVWLCPLHQAAPKLLKACKEAKKALDLNDEFGSDLDARHRAEEEAWHFLTQVIRLAGGK